jgi:hypothetical protein
MDKPTSRKWSLAVAALMVAGLAACGGGSSGGGTAPNDDIEDIVGHYKLVMTDDATTPVTIDFEACDDVGFRVGEMLLSDDGTWQTFIRFFDADGAEQDATDSGQFSRADNRLLFQSEDYGDQFKGEIKAGLVHLYYDWCGEGHADVDFEFAAD